MAEISEKYGAPLYESVEALLADKDKLQLTAFCVRPHRAHTAVGKAALAASLRSRRSQ